MASTWLGNSLGRMGLYGPAHNDHIIRLLGNDSLTEEDRSSRVHAYLEKHCIAKDVNLPDTVADFFMRYNQGTLLKHEAVLTKPVSTINPLAKVFVPSFAIPVVKTNAPVAVEMTSRNAWARIDDDEADDPYQDDEPEGFADENDFGQEFDYQGSEYVEYDGDQIPESGEYDGYDHEGYGGSEGDYYQDENGHYYEIQLQGQGAGLVMGSLDEAILGMAHQRMPLMPILTPTSAREYKDDPFDDDEFNPFAAPTASDLELQKQWEVMYPPTILYSDLEEHDGIVVDEDGNSIDEELTPLEMMSLIISDASSKEIEMALAKAGYDMDQALLNIILDRQKAADAKLAYMIDNIPTGDQRLRQPCRHFLAGNCLRKDCWYSHDLDITVCKFWLNNKCLKGDSCEFNHFIDTGKVGERVMSNNITLRTTVAPKMDESDFPSLSMATVVKSKRGKTAISSMAPATENTPTVKTTPEISTPASISTQVDQLADVVDSKFNLFTVPTLSYSATAAAVAEKPLTELARPTPSANHTGLGHQPNSSANAHKAVYDLSLVPDNIPWMETGTNLNTNYLAMRAQASKHAQARNQCFEQAALAYKANDGAAAASFSAKGREFNELMMTIHREASRQIFETRNMAGGNGGSATKDLGGSLSKRGRKESWIDLHGLHVEESLVFLDEFMARMEAEKWSGVLYIVTGGGYHSKGKRPKLMPAVEEWLTDWGYKWREIKPDGHVFSLVACQVLEGRP